MRLDFGVMRSPNEIIFGIGQIKSLGKATAKLGKKALICTDSRFASLNIMKEIISDLEDNNVSVQIFQDTEAELPLKTILDCVEKHRLFNPDVIIGLGGGSCLDMAKLVSLKVTFDQPLSDFYGEFKVPGEIRPVIAVPTTSGTGSEATPVAVLADPQKSTKIGISSPQLIPKIAICDPDLTKTCPKMLTAISGADALAHAIESYASAKNDNLPNISSQRVFIGKNAFTDVLALASIKNIFMYLQQAVNDGDNLEARSAVMLGSTLAGLAFGTGGTGATHAIQYPIGADTKTAHGLGIGILLPYVIEYNLPSAQQDYAYIARELGITNNKDDTQAARCFLNSVKTLFANIGIPKSLKDISVSLDKLEYLAEMSLNAKRLVDNNPRKLDKIGVLEIINNAI